MTDYNIQTLPDALAQGDYAEAITYDLQTIRVSIENGQIG